MTRVQTAMYYGGPCVRVLAIGLVCWLVPAGAGWWAAFWIAAAIGQRFLSDASEMAFTHQLAKQVRSYAAAHKELAARVALLERIKCEH